MIITISGTAGSGKSSVGRRIAKALKFKHYSIGDFMRELAREKNLSLEDIGKIAEGDKSIDIKLDRRQVELGKTEDDFVIDARLGFLFIPGSIKIFLDGELKTRAERIWKDIKVKGKRKEERADTIREIIEEMQNREKNEQKRYFKYYQVDPYDQKHYDCVVDTTSLTQEEVTQKVLEFLKP